MAYRVKSYRSYTNDFSYRNPYSQNLGSVSSSTIGALTEGMLHKWSQVPEVPESRSGLKRSLDVLLAPNYAVAGAADALVLGKNPLTAGIKGLASGLNFFSDAPMFEQKTFSNVLEDSGWKPTSAYGRFAKGAAGLALDIALDPTTYLTFGGSALAKGTGSAALKVAEKSAVESITKRFGVKAADSFELPALVADKVLKDNIAKGVAPDLAERFAKSRAAEVEQLLAPYRGGMTESVARDVIERHAKQKGYTISPEQLKVDAQKLSNKFNKAIGFNPKTVGMTLSLDNAPLINRLFPKSWRDKKLVFGDGSSIAKFSDRTGLSLAYSNLRKSIYGTKLGKLFSTKSGLYKLSQTSPSEFYDVVKYMDYTNGLNIDKVSKENLIFDKVKELKNLTPAEQNNIVKALQDSRAFAKVNQVVKFADTQEAELTRSNVMKQKVAAQEEIANMLKEKDDIDRLISAVDRDVADVKSALPSIRDEYRQKLINMRNTHMLELSEKSKLLKELEDEAAAINIVENGDKLKVTDSIADEAMVKEIGLYHGNYKNMEKSFSDHMKQMNELAKKFVPLPKLAPDADAAAIAAHREATDLATEWNKAVSKEVQAFKDSAPRGRISERDTLIGKLSEYIFGDAKAIKSSTLDGNIDTLVEMVQSGASKADLAYHIEKYNEFYSGRASEIYPFVARKLGYGKGTKYPTWKEYYTDRVEQYMKRIEQFGFGTPQGEAAYDEVIKLNQKKLERDMWLAKFRKEPDMKGVMRIISDDVDSQLLDDVAKLNDPEAGNVLERNRSRIADDLRAKEGRQYSDLQDFTEYNLNMTSPERAKLVEDLIGLANPKYINDYVTNYFSMVATQAQALIKNVFKVPYDKLTEAQRGLLYKLAFTNVSRLKDGKPLITAIGKDYADMQRNVLQQAELARVGALKRSIRQDSQIYFKRDGSPVTQTGVVRNVSGTDGVTHYEVHLPNGEVLTDITPSMITKVVIGDVKKTGDELIMSSPLANADVERKMNLLGNVTQLKGSMEQSKHKFRMARSNVVDEYVDRVQNMNKTVAAMESYKNGFIQKLNDLDFDAADNLMRDIERYDNVLASDEALETYAELVAPGSVNKATNIPGIMLDNSAEYASFSAKEKEIAKMLRADFIEMGKSEVAAGKMNVKQFEAMMNHYVPHILTDEGQRFIEKYALKWNKATNSLVAIPRNIEKRGSYVTQDLGYGRVWNNHGVERSIKSVYIDGEWVHNPTIEQINQSVSHLLQGKNLFSENVADVYLTRALKNTNLLYDNAYMHNMLNVFGKEFKAGKEAPKGYKTVMNYGKYKDVANKLPSAVVSMEISEAVTDYVTTLFASGERMTTQELDTLIADFMKKNYSKETVNQMFTRYQDGFYNYVGMNKKNFDSTATPMLELNKLQAESVVDYHSSVMRELNEKLERTRQKMDKWETRMANHPEYYEVMERYARRIEGMEARISQLDGALVRNVNDTIVNKANQARKVQLAKDANRFLQVYDKWTHLLKLNMTTIMPSFHARNKMANVFLNWLGVGGEALSARNQRDAWKTVWHKGDADKVKGTFSINRNDVIQEMSYSDAYKLAMQHGVVDEGFFAKDIGAGAQSGGVVGGRFDPTDTKDFILYKKGAEVGSQIENSDRFLHFVAKLKMGASPEEAAESVNKYLFDYSELTSFEQNVMKRVIPFYTFMRKNGELQLRELLTQPKKYQTVAKLIQGIEGMTNEEDRLNMGLVNKFARDWIQTPMSVINPRGNREPIMINPNLPFQDLSRIPSPLSPIDSVLNLFTQSNPLIKAPIEQLLNHNTYFNQPITSGGSAEAGDRLDHLASQTAWYNAGKDLATKSGNDWWFELMANTTGVKGLSYDYEGLKNLAIRDFYRGTPDEKVGDAVKDAISSLPVFDRNTYSPSRPIMPVPQEDEQIDELMDELFE